MADPPFAGARPVVTAEAVQKAWMRLASGIQPLINSGPCLLIGVLVGGIVPLVNIAARLKGDFVIDYCHVTRYLGGTSGGEIRWLQRPHQPLVDRIVILIDDIFDEGETLADLRRYCTDQGARRVLVAVLARKRHERPIAAPLPDFIGVEVPDEYVFGCGMDLREHWRHLDAIYSLSPGATGARNVRE